MKKTKLITTLVALCLVAAVGVGATLAYFTDKDSATNVVTMGHVDIDLVETSESEKATSITDDGITYKHVVPGDTIDKQAKVVVKSGSEDCYVRINVTVEPAAGVTVTDAVQKDLATLRTELYEGIIGDGSTWLGASANTAEGTGNKYSDNATKQFYCQKKLSAGDSVDIFKSVKIPAEWGNEAADLNFVIKINAEAIQADNVEDVVKTYTSNGKTGIYQWTYDGDSVNAKDIPSEDILEYNPTAATTTTTTTTTSTTE